MKKLSQTILVMIAVILLFTSCKGLAMRKKSLEPDKPENTEAFVTNNFVGSLYKGNFVWGIAMNFAWNELGNSILHEKLKLASSDATVKQIENAFNTFLLSKEVLDDASYYAKAGYGQKTVNAINKEVRKKFPKKTFGDLKTDLGESDIISYAYFVKAVEYLYVFEDTDFEFMGEPVKGFYATNKNQRDSVYVIKYENADKFIVQLRLKDKSDCLFLAKGYDMKNPKTVLKAIKKEKHKNKPKLSSDDIFYVPNIKLNYRRDYVELLGKFFDNKGFEEYFIAQMYENIKFNMDKKGAKVENEAVIIALKSAGIMEEPRMLIFDKPYWIVMQRSESDTPYFLLGINNSKLMQKSDK
ncbi:MAG: hypothetical protein CR988_01595 [Treponema sp.]|nr:MAG: hypothetical protein CR988_01595 [Treponema sp.]